MSCKYINVSALSLTSVPCCSSTPTSWQLATLHWTQQPCTSSSLGDAGQHCCGVEMLLLGCQLCPAAQRMHLADRPTEKCTVVAEAMTTSPLCLLAQASRLLKWLITQRRRWCSWLTVVLASMHSYCSPVVLLLVPDLLCACVRASVHV